MTNFMELQLRIIERAA
jgi:hypothetical protein